jgi:hypothetical protein
MNKRSILISLTAAILGRLVTGMPVSAQTCAPSIVLDLYICEWNIPLGKCVAKVVLGGPFTKLCHSLPACETNENVCSSNDIDTCVGDSPDTCHFDPPICSRSPCTPGSGLPGTSCGTDTCGPCQRCAKVDEKCTGPLCEKKCVGGQCPPAPTPVPNRPPVCGAQRGILLLRTGSSNGYVS